MLANFLQDLYAAVSLAGLTLFLLVLFLPQLRERFERRVVPRAEAVDVAFIRIVACAVLLIYVLTEDLASQAVLGPRWFDPPGHMRWLGRDVFDWFMSSEARLQALTWFVLAMLMLGLAGCATRVTLPLAALSYLLLAGFLRSFGKHFHEGYLGFYALTVLCFLPCADVWSVDSRWLRPLWNRLRGNEAAAPARDAAYGWAVYACYFAIAFPYLALGLSKLIMGGWFWFDGRSLRNYMLTDDLNLHDYDLDLALRFVGAPTILFTIGGLIALLVELTYPLVLVSPRLRRLLPPIVALLHLGIWLAQDLRFLDAMLIPCIFVMPSALSWWRMRARTPVVHSSPVEDRSGGDHRPPGPGRLVRARRWMRGPGLPIALIFAILFLHYTKYRGVIPWEWPVEKWSMYAPKAPVTSVIHYRRFVAHHADGRSEAIDLGRAIAFLDKPYRLDRGLKRDLSTFLTICLRELRKNEGTSVVGLTYEKRRWRYRRLSLEDHLVHERPSLSYRVAVVDPPIAQPLETASTGRNLLMNGGFEKFNKRSGVPAGWDLSGSWLGIGIDALGGGRSALLSAAPAAQSLSQKVALPGTMLDSDVQLHAQALVRSAGPGAAIEIEVIQAGSGKSTRRAELTGDGAWHRLEVELPVAKATKGIEVRIVLHAPGAADVFYDDVRLFAIPTGQH